MGMRMVYRLRGIRITERKGLEEAILEISSREQRRIAPGSP